MRPVPLSCPREPARGVQPGAGGLVLACGLLVGLLAGPPPTLAAPGPSLPEVGPVPAAFPSGPAAAAQDPEGLWLVEDENAAIEIRRCDQGLCGEIRWLDPEGDGEVYDVENPDEELRDRPLCGLEILSGFEQDPDDPTTWEDGEIYAPDDGRSYSARVRVEGPDEIDVRGYVGISIFGRSETWRRVSPDDYPECEPPDEPPPGR